MKKSNLEGVIVEGIVVHVAVLVVNLFGVVKRVEVLAHGVCFMACSIARAGGERGERGAGRAGRGRRTAASLPVPVSACLCLCLCAEEKEELLERRLSCLLKCRISRFEK